MLFVCDRDSNSFSVVAGWEENLSIWPGAIFRYFWLISGSWDRAGEGVHPRRLVWMKVLSRL